MNLDLAPLEKAVAPLWKQLKLLFAEHHFLTIVCGFFAVLMTISFYKFLRSISPALVVFVLLLILVILLMHWTQTRTEPAFLKPFVDWFAPFFPSAPLPAKPPLRP
jgi:hypothetical protein